MSNATVKVVDSTLTGRSPFNRSAVSVPLSGPFNTGHILMSFRKALRHTIRPSSQRTMVPLAGYHDGELAVQRKAGTAEQAARYLGFVRPYVDQQLSLFAEERSDVIAASVDGEGRLWASMLFGAPGFTRVLPDAASMVVGADGKPAVSKGDPLWHNAQADGAPLGFLFIELHTRRRNRINGHSRPLRAPAGGLFVEVDEAFGNCPKYITARVIAPGSKQTAHQETAPPNRTSTLTAAQQRLIAQADVLYMATANPAGGADASHRGGSPGFVRVLDEKTLLWPDYTGNGMFMTLGNLQLNPSAGVLFIDWAAHSLLHLTGRAKVLYEADIQRRQLAPLLGGAERAVLFHVDQSLLRPNSVPFDYRLLSYSPYNYPVPDDDQLVLKGQTVTLTRVDQVTSSVKQFTFETKEALQYLPGQYAMFALQLPREGGGATQAVTRCWTIVTTAKPCHHSFAIAVKRLPTGRASIWLHDVVQPGTAFQLVGTEGDFSCFSPDYVVASPRLLFLSAGIGVTPMLAMLRGLRAAKTAPLDVVAVHTARTAADIPFRSEMSVESSGEDDFRFLENLTERDGRLSAEWLLTRVPDVATRQVYLCGPAGYMTAVTALLEALGVPSSSIHTETFSY